MTTEVCGRYQQRRRDLLTSSDTLFILLGAIMVPGHARWLRFWSWAQYAAGAGSMPWSKCITDFGVSTLAYFFIGYTLAYGQLPGGG